MKILEKWHGPVYCDAMLVMCESKQTVAWSQEDIIHLFGSEIERNNWTMRLIGDLPIGKNSFCNAWAHGEYLGQLWLIERVR